MTVGGDLAEWLRSQGLQVRRRVRVLMLLDAVDYAVLAPNLRAAFSHTCLLGGCTQSDIPSPSDVWKDIEATVFPVFPRPAVGKSTG